MSKDKGWVKLHRDIMDHWMWEDEPFTKAQAWIDLILLANHKEERFHHRGKIINGERGCVYRSISWLAKRWKWSRDKTRSFLHLLENDGMVTVNSSVNQTAIALVNYGKYQDLVTADSSANRQLTDSYPTADRQLTDTYKNNKSYKNAKKLEEEGDARAREGAAAIPLEDGTEYIITNTQLEQLVQRYPGLDVRRELIRAVNWCKDNPEKLKPRSGAWRFVTGWLTRAEKDREAAEAAPVVVRSAAAKNSFHNFEERENTHLDDLFPGDIVNAEVG